MEKKNPSDREIVHLYHDVRGVLYVEPFTPSDEEEKFVKYGMYEFRFILEGKGTYEIIRPDGTLDRIELEENTLSL